MEQTVSLEYIELSFGCNLYRVYAHVEIILDRGINDCVEKGWKVGIMRI